MSKSQKLNIVDENDKIIGEDTRESVHKKGLLHREVHVWIYNNKGEVLLQKRSLNKDTFPGLWDASVGGHVEMGDSYKQSAIKEAKEEIGIIIDKNKLVLITKNKNKYNDKKTKTINSKFTVDYAYEYNGLLNNLKIEKDKIIGLEFWSINKILGLPEKDKKRFIFFLSKDYIDIFRKTRELVKSKHL